MVPRNVKPNQMYLKNTTEKVRRHPSSYLTTLQDKKNLLLQEKPPPTCIHFRLVNPFILPTFCIEGTMLQRY